MNYYERHLGDYAKDAGHLTMLEHGAYGLLLDRYYTTEQGIQADQAHRVCRARTEDEKAAVDIVLAEFFVLKDGVWTHDRVEREITKMQAKVKAAQENGKRGGRPKATKDEAKANQTASDQGAEQKPGGFPVGSIQGAQEKAHQTPDARHHKESASALSTRARVGAALIASGLDKTTVNTADPRLMALIDQGATPAEFEGVGREAAAKGKGVAWALVTLAARRAEAAKMAARPGKHAGFQSKDYREGVASDGSFS